MMTTPTLPSVLDAVDVLVQRNNSRELRRANAFEETEAQPLNDAFESVGEPVSLTTLDMCSDGIGFVTHERIEAKFLLMELPSFFGTLTLEVLWSRELADGSYQHGGRWVSTSE